jgi:hypothetical protein
LRGMPGAVSSVVGFGRIQEGKTVRRLGRFGPWGMLLSMLDRQAGFGSGGSHTAKTAFIQEVRLHSRPARRGVDGLLLGFWGLLLLKCVLSTWAVAHWDMPVSSFWVWLPSIIFGAVCTMLYLMRP